MQKNDGTRQSTTERLQAIPESAADIFDNIDADGDGEISGADLLRILQQRGIQIDDPRLQTLKDTFFSSGTPDTISKAEFCEAAEPCTSILHSLVTGSLVIPDFQTFTEQVEEIVETVAKNTEGSVATYIPQLADVDPEQFAVAACTIDGQRLLLGDHDTPFCVQSTCKPVSYLLAQKENGTDKVHQHIGREPSGRGFNELTLNNEGRPHNPMINAGAIMSGSLIGQGLDAAARFNLVMQAWADLSASSKVGFNNAVFLSEKETADRNFALGYFMREKKAFPEGTDLAATLNFYFQCCSVDMTAGAMSVVAATLANAGVNPLTGKRIFEATHVKNCLSLMYSCGMYDFSGEFAFTVGLPAKSGVSGAILVVVPNVLGLAIWSPRLDALGNSVRGLKFCEALVQRFNFHHYDNLTDAVDKIDPRRKRYEATIHEAMSMLWAASLGDMMEIQRLVAIGTPVNCSDYDGRTPLHLAAAEGHEEVVQYFLSCAVDINAKDRWGHSAIEDARRGGHERIVTLLEQA